MGIDFNDKRWNKIKETYSLWWNNKLDRPIIPVVINKTKTLSQETRRVPLLTQATCDYTKFTAEEMVERIDQEISSKIYLGDSFPFVNLDVFGAGIIAAFLGAKLDNETGNVWFNVNNILPISEIHFEYDPANYWLKKIKEFCFAAIKKWKGQVIVGMPDLGGILDILSVFRTADYLLMDLYDEPDEVKRLIFELHDLWMRFFNELNHILIQGELGYSDWSGIYSEKPVYIIQSDFSYMISPDHFLEYVLPQIEKWTNRIDRTIYHMDGEGQLKHFDFLLNLKNLDGIQWVPGPTKKPLSTWDDIYTKIYQAGKKTQVWSGFDALGHITKELNIKKGISHIEINADFSDINEIKRKLYEYGIE